MKRLLILSAVWGSLLGSLWAQAPDPASTLDDFKATPAEIKDVQKAAALWVRNLGIGDWDIKIYIVPIFALQVLCPVPCMAASHWDVEHMAGTMYILRRADYTPELLKARHIIVTPKADQRDSVLHEMLHMVIDDMTEEGAVVTLTRAFKP